MQLVTSIVFTFSSNVFDIETLKKSLPKVLNWRVNWPYLNSLVYESLLLIYSKYFAVFVWLKSPGWSFMTNWGWPNLEDWSSLIDGIVTWKRDCLHGLYTVDKPRFKTRPPSCLFTSEPKKWRSWVSRQRGNSWISDWNWTEELRGYAKHIARWMLSTF